MSKEIREELAKRRYYDGMVGIGSGIPRWEDRTEVEREHFRAKIEEDFKYLHSKGVVIKGDCLGASHPHLAAYYTVEPLIEKDDRGNCKFTSC